LESLVAVFKVVVAFVGKLLMSVLGRQVSEELKAWTPLICKKLVQIATDRLQPEDRDRYQEEWNSYLNEVPGDASKILVAIGFLFAARRMSPVRGDAGIYRLLKSVFDTAVSAAMTLCLIPLFALIVLAIKVSDWGRPTFQKETRLGLNRRPIQLLKFRTLDSRGRVMAIGRLLRRHDLESLPEILNVLRGDMAMVGPRPMQQCHADALPSEAHVRFSVKPGITGLWQVDGHPDWESLVKCDIAYVKDKGMLFDMKILFKTVAKYFIFLR
jgi:lipopolysaccharide/colanic/teichoic acid biosynthesis glycosyltransferase